MDKKYIDFVARGLAIGAFTLLMLALSSGGMYFIENLSIQFFGEELPFWFSFFMPFGQTAERGPRLMSPSLQRKGSKLIS